MQTGRRTFIKHALAGGVTLTGLAGILHSRQAPAAIASDSLRPMAPWGLQIGDVVGDRAIVWSRADRPARMFVEWSRDENFANAADAARSARARRQRLTARIDLTEPAGGKRCLRARASSRISTPARRAASRSLGRFRTPPAKRRDIRFVWSRRHGRPGLGHRPRLRRHEDLRSDAARAAGLLHPLRRHDLRRRPDARSASPTRPAS